MNVGLPLHNRTQLDAVIPAQERHGDYLTNGQFDGEYTPTSQSAAAVQAWARSKGVRVTHTSADGLTVAQIKYADDSDQNGWTDIRRVNPTPSKQYSCTGSFRVWRMPGMTAFNVYTYAIEGMDSVAYLHSTLSGKMVVWAS